MTTLTPKFQCKAKNPRECRYHGAYARMNDAIDMGANDVALKAIEEIKAMEAERGLFRQEMREANGGGSRFFADDDVMKKRDAAKMSQTPQSVLVDLSKSTDTITRIGVAANKSADSKILRKLAKDKDWGVRRAVAANLTTPPDVKVELSKDSNTWVREAVVYHPSYT